MSFFNPFDDQSRDINLSTSAAASSTALLSSIRAERQAREQQRKDDHAARTIQRIWRGRRDAAEARDTVLRGLENGSIGDWRRQASALIFLGRVEGDETLGKRKREVLVKWSRAATRKQMSSRASTGLMLQ
jgi:ubiquitin-protein ligase E3 C